jgi:hypothetical protein
MKKWRVMDKKQAVYTNEQQWTKKKEWLWCENNWKGDLPFPSHWPTLLYLLVLLSVVLSKTKIWHTSHMKSTFLVFIRKCSCSPKWRGLCFFRKSSKIEGRGPITILVDLKNTTYKDVAGWISIFSDSDEIYPKSLHPFVHNAQSICKEYQSTTYVFKAIYRLGVTGQSRILTSDSIGILNVALFNLKII